MLGSDVSGPSPLVRSLVDIYASLLWSRGAEREKGKTRNIIFLIFRQKIRLSKNIKETSFGKVRFY